MYKKQVMIAQKHMNWKEPLQFGKSYDVIMSASIIARLFNGNLGVIQSYLANITVKSIRFFAFSTMAIAFSAGSILGSIAGGMLYDVRLWIFTTHYTPQKYSFPYSLISFISCCIHVIDVKHVRKEYFGTKDITKNGNKDIETQELDQFSDLSFNPMETSDENKKNLNEQMLFHYLHQARVPEDDEIDNDNDNINDNNDNHDSKESSANYRIIITDADHCFFLYVSVIIYTVSKVIFCCFNHKLFNIFNMY